MRTQNGRLVVSAAIVCSIFTLIGSTAVAKTAKECIAEWRADKAGMQARGVKQYAYVEQCKAGTPPTAAASENKSTAPATAPAPKQALPTAQPSPAQPTQKSAPTVAAAPVTPSAKGGAALEPGQFADEAAAKARCPADTVVWVNFPSKVYHYAGAKSYGTTKRGVYMCEKEAITGENRASKTGKRS